ASNLQRRISTSIDILQRKILSLNVAFGCLGPNFIPICWILWRILPSLAPNQHGGSVNRHFCCTFSLCVFFNCC
ncbi:Uncharacterized protein APZ42_006518, partial [Daphnia magna]